MSDLLTFARPYAQAAFAFAKEKNALSDWQSSLVSAAQAVQEPKLKVWLQDPSTSVSEGVEFLAGAVNGGDFFKNLLSQLADNNRLELLPAIAELFIDLVKKDEQVIVAKVESAYELSSEEIASITANLKQKLGKDVEVNATLNESLIAGIRVQAGDLVIDNTVKGRLDKMADGLSLSANN